jgi:hypothetical protein
MLALVPALLDLALPELSSVAELLRDRIGAKSNPSCSASLCRRRAAIELLPRIVCAVFFC